MKDYNKPSKTAKKFIKRINGIVTFDSIVNYLQVMGFAVIYYSTPECLALMEKYNLVNLSTSVNAFTYSCDSVKLVFINDKISLHDMLCAITHEAAHIFLGHLSSNPYAIDSRENEMEAEAVAYAILHYRKAYTPSLMISVALVALISIIIMHSCSAGSVDLTTYVPTVTINPAEQNNEVLQSVLVTPSGEKFHRPDCRYTKNKNCITLDRSEAVNKYAPCSVCKP